jgi:hypothetical protein
MKSKVLMELIIDPSNPVEELKACIATVSLQHGTGQLAILKDLDLWLGRSIEEIESRNMLEQQTNTEK